MNLRLDAHADLIDIMSDTDGGTWPCTVTSPAGDSVSFVGWTSDIFLSIDPGTGQTVSARQASVSLSILDLINAGMDDITGVPDTTSKPWRVDTTDINGRDLTYKVLMSHPDNGIGLTLIDLEVYTP